MADSNDQTSKRRTQVIKMLRQARDAGLDSAARVVLAVTKSEPYSRATSSLAKPGLVLTAIVRHKTDAAMTQVLSHINMPSRDDVLSLSTRLTHIETALDDLSAAVDQMRAPAKAARPARRGRQAAQGE